MSSIAILITVHNRKDKTLQCLIHLFLQQVVEGIEWEVFLTDDGCTDGTAEAVKENYPSVHIVSGDGNLYWNRGMHKAWEAASKAKDYDFYLWLNDDTLLNADALLMLMQNSKTLNDKSIVVGTTTDIESTAEITYGGRKYNGGLITPSIKPIECNYFNGNIVFIPKFVFEKVGKNDPIFHHALGDFDYGLRAAKIGVKSYVATRILGSCDLHVDLATWCNPKKPFTKRWKAFKTPLGHNPEEFFIFEKRHGGFGKAVLHYFTNYLRVFFPVFWNNRV